MVEVTDVKPANPLMNIVSSVLNIGDRFSKVFVEERNKRARVELDKLKEERKELLRAPKCTTQIAVRIQAIDKRTEELNSYLINNS